MRTSLLLFSFLFFLVGMAHGYSQPRPDNFKVVGEATLKVLWFNIYDARLENSTGEYQGLENPMLLHLKYYRDISRDDLLKETGKQWRRQGFETAEISLWLSQLEAIWPDIKEQDSLAFFQDEQAVGHFYFNDQYIGMVSDPAFSKAFLAIWLAKDSAFPAVSQALKGE